MKKIFYAIVLLSGLCSNAQERTVQDLEKIKKELDAKPNGWKKGGLLTLTFNQSAFNNDWTGGGVSNMSGNIGLNYDLNYKKDDVSWDNKFIASYGLTKIKGEDLVRKTDDRLIINSIVGKKASGYWFYSGFVNFKTQFDAGFLLDGTGKPTGVKNSHFMSPAYIQAGPGMLWKKSDNLKVNIAPATSRLILVDSYFTQYGSSFGVAQGKSSRFEFGASVNAYYKTTLMENVTIENNLGLYANYLDKPQNIDIDYNMNLVMKINKYISTNLAFQAIYDDNTIGAFQIREVFGLGVNYGF
ncbi:hypothetical protein B0A58_01985 [Flavobacterium branchiophilum NBRC 15030 = ATCC 35035]|uniref:DUF3078 family protein n=1 Tax=Flavobacterium branchiophilum TaxID=55197 RepID=A0A543G2S5_9FLAO|nr:DUF3078 domain-containing protein [Flavobacterium branchiophilum]OXA80863.1 hypothetical protein B0A58_01985 [Flavobacterium branchiophilum NBRC 15030 = ATCC 35035]TQM40396.1 DUF3078 family protein [Flavobacterium branchiophilum]GEM54477.1 protein of unknown function precursor [Flavobacterium branchiophilum NBRC 15030 = ATCC 35035]